MSWKGISRAVRPCRASWPGGKATPASDENVLQEPHFQSANKLKQTKFPSAMSWKHQDTITLAPLLLPRPRVARCPIDFCKTRCVDIRDLSMFTCLLGSSAFIAIQNDPNLLYNTVFFLSLCLFCLAMNSVWLKWKVTMDAILLRAHHPDLSLIYFGSRSSALLNCHKLMTVFLNISQLCVTISQECVSYLSCFFRVLRLVHLLSCARSSDIKLWSTLICFRCCQLCLVLPCFRWMVFSIPSDLLTNPNSKACLSTCWLVFSQVERCAGSRHFNRQLVELDAGRWKKDSVFCYVDALRQCVAWVFAWLLLWAPHVTISMFG